MIHSNQRLDSTRETVIKFNEPQQNARVYSIGHLVKDFVGISSTIHTLKTVKLWQDIFSAWPFDRPIVDYWIWAAPESNIRAKLSYTVFDMLADVGGLVFIFGVIGRFLLDTCARGNLAAVMASRLYTWRD